MLSTIVIGLSITLSDARFHQFGFAAREQAFESLANP